MTMTTNAASGVDQGSLEAIFDGPPGQSLTPVVQCVQVKPLANSSPPNERFRVVFSDIKNFVQTMLATQANHHVYDGKLKKGCFVRLKAYNASFVKGKKILIILDLDVLEELGESEKIGEPKALEIKPEGGDSKGQPGSIQSDDFYGNKGQTQQNQQRSIPTHTKQPSSSAHTNIYPIEALSPYSHKWTIKARCTNKSDIKTWHNRNGEGKLFSVNLLDESGEIRATGFKEQCDLLYDVFQENSVYFISSPCRVQIAKKQFSNLNNDYELTFERDTQVEKAEEQDGVPQVRFNFTGIADLQDVQKDTTVDVMGILKEVGETSQVTSKTTSKPYDKRELTLVDNTGFSVRLTVWGKTAASFDVSTDSVVAFKGVKVSDFGGRSLSLLSSGSMTVNPDIDEAHRLRGWYDAQGRTDSFETHANLQGAGVGAAGGRGNDFKTIAQVKEEQLGMSEEADFFSTRASIMFIKQESFAYPACLDDKCNKKVIETNPGEWHCERCNVTHPKPEYRYVMSINVSDHTGQIWLSAFNETGVAIMGHTADELMNIKEQDDSSDSKRLGEIFQEANHKIWNFRCKAKMDHFQDQQRVRYQISSASPVNFVQESTRLAELIKSYHI